MTDIITLTLNHILADGPVGVRNIAFHLYEQCPTVKEADQALADANRSINYLLEARHIQVYDDTDTGDDISYV